MFSRRPKEEISMNKYEKQKYANILALLTAEEFAAKKLVLERVCRALDRTKVTWAFGMSFSLFMRGIADEFDDFDVIIAMEDVPEFTDVFCKLGGEIGPKVDQTGSIFRSGYFRQAKLDGVKFDLIADFQIESYRSEYRYIIQKKDIDVLYIEGGLNVPVIPVEANFLLYYMLTAWQSRRWLKVQMCEDYLKEEGLAHREVFQRLMYGEEFWEARVRDYYYNNVPSELFGIVEQLLKA